MKKYYIVFALAIVLTSCGGGGTSESQVEEIEDTSSANQIIGFNNEVVDYMNETSRHIKNAAGISDDLSRMIEEKVNRRPNTTTTFIGRTPNIEKILKSAPGEISDQMKNNLKELDKNYQLAKEQNKIIGKYLKNQDYKDDDWKKAAELNASFSEGINNYYKNKDLVSKELRVLGDKAEEKILENHPLKNPILAAKKDLVLAADLQALMFAEMLDREAINVAYDLLEKSSQQHREEFNDTLEEQEKKKSYDSFHEEIDDFLGEIRKTLRFNRELKTGDYNSISVDYKSVIGGYNSFVN